jgi:hypothetical protein
MQDYSISRCSRKCAKSGRELEPGESYVSVILPHGDGVQRLDIAASEWTAPESEAVGWWRSRMPEAGARKLRAAPNGVLLDTLSQLVETPGSEGLAYLLALLLVRRRVLSEDSSVEITTSTVDSAEIKDFRWDLICPADGRKWSVPVVEFSPSRLPDLQSQLNSLLFTEE